MGMSITKASFDLKHWRGVVKIGVNSNANCTPFVLEHFLAPVGLACLINHTHSKFVFFLLSVKYAQ